MKKLNSLIKKILSGFIATVSIIIGLASPVSAMNYFAVSPMHQKISLVPGERYYGTFKITNPNDSTADFCYNLSVKPFRINENYEAVYENNGDYSQIVEWISFEEDNGVIAPNNTNIVRFYVDVPENAPAGGQYAAIFVNSINDAEGAVGVNIGNKYSISHILYADVAGETVRNGTIDNINVPSWLFSGNISASATITNTGNVHSDATYRLQIFPLFSNEETFTNEEDPKVSTIVPEATRTNVITWENTPSIGIFRVVFNVDFEGVNANVKKIVIVCPLWLLFLILLALFLLIFRILSVKKKSKK